MNDPRHRKPSASYLEQMSLCPGSWMAQQNIPEQPTSDSRAGDVIHKALAGDSEARANLTSDETRTYETLEFRYANLLFGFEMGANSYRMTEERLWSRNQEFSGQLDRAEIYGVRGVVADFKSGHLEVTDSPRNLQLRAQAVLLWQNHGVIMVQAAIIPAWQPMPLPVEYDLDDLKRAELEILEIIANAQKENAPRVPGEKQCRYCKFRPSCPEARETMLAVEPVAKMPLPAIPAKELADYLDKLPTIKKIISDLEDEAKRRLQAGEQVPGYELKAGEAREKIVNLPVIHARAAAIGITVDQFTAACSLTKKAAKELIEAATKKKGKALDDELKSLIADCCEDGKTPEPTLKKLSETTKQKAG